MIDSVVNGEYLQMCFIDNVSFIEQPKSWSLLDIKYIER